LNYETKNNHYGVRNGFIAVQRYIFSA